MHQKNLYLCCREHPNAPNLMFLHCFFLFYFVVSVFILIFAARNYKVYLIMEANKSTFERPTHEEVRKMFRRAKARQQQLEEEGRRMWEEEQRIKAEAKEYYELEYA